MKTLPFALLLLVGASCAPSSRKAESPELNIDTLLARQVRMLAEGQVTLTKSADVSSNRTDTTFVPDYSEWQSELEVFSTLGILDERLYQGTYRIEDPVDDPHSNLQIRRYTNHNAPLRMVQISYQGELIRMRQIMGIVEENNPLYAARRELTLRFDDIHGTPALASYRIHGFQKAALRDTVRYTIEGTVNW
jgi:hypothetical protein